MEGFVKESIMTEIKICGLTRPEEAAYLNEASIDYAGFVFYEKSRRNVSIKRAEQIMKELDPSIKKVAVTVSPDSVLIDKLQNSGFDILQVHGELSEEVLKMIQKPVFLAMNIEDVDNLYEKLKFYEMISTDLSGKINGILADAPQFGSGKPFNWHRSRRLLQAGDRSSPLYGKKFILAGGLNSENVAQGIRIFNPDAVDVSSSVEGEDGKSRDKIQEFVKAVRKGEINE